MQLIIKNKTKDEVDIILKNAGISKINRDEALDVLEDNARQLGKSTTGDLERFIFSIDIEESSKGSTIKNIKFIS